MIMAPEVVLSPWTDGLVPMVHCRQCHGLYRDVHHPCPVCQHQMEPDVFPEGYGQVDVPRYTLEGAAPDTIFVLLDLMRNEWERPLSVTNGMSGRVSPRLVIVILFWTAFEVLMEQFFEAAFADDPENKELRRTPNIGQRLDRVYRDRWGKTFWDDLADIGYPEVARHLQTVQHRRNAFIHGDAEAIDEALVASTVAMLLDVQLAWIALFNKRCTGRQNKIPVWAFKPKP